MRKKGLGAGSFLIAAAFSLLGVMPAAGAIRLPAGVSADDQTLSGLTREEAKQAIQTYIAGLSGQLIILNIQGNPAAATAGDLGLYWNNEEEVDQVIDDYENSSLLKRYLMAADWEKEPMSIPLELFVPDGAVQLFVEQSCQNQGIAGQNATIIRENGQFIITPEVMGLEVDVEATQNALKQALAGGLKQEIVVEAIIRESQPTITAAHLGTIQDVLGSFSTDFSSSGSARSTNLSVGAEKIDGHVLMPGETLSGYACLQPFTVENGYRTAAAYENGQVVDSIGGGVCQIATTLYNAALLAELEITQRQNHSMTVGYVKPSQDAAIAGTFKDIKVTNPYSTPIYIEGYTKGRTLTFTIYGLEVRPQNRSIRFESETLSTVNPGNPKEVLNPALAPGTRRQVQSAHRGLKSRLWKVVTVDGVETERILLSTDTYNASPAIVQVGPAVSAPVQPPQPVAPVLPQPEVPVVLPQQPAVAEPGNGAQESAALPLPLPEADIALPVPPQILEPGAAVP